jgi:hypothetical protein
MRKLHFGEKKTRINYEIYLTNIVFLQSSSYKENAVFKVTCEKHRSEKIIGKTVKVSLSTPENVMFSVEFNQAIQIAASLYQDETCLILQNFLLKPLRFTIKQVVMEAKRELSQDVGTFSLNLNEYADQLVPHDLKIDFIDSMNKGFVELSIRSLAPDRRSLNSKGDLPFQDVGSYSGSAGRRSIESTAELSSPPPPRPLSYAEGYTFGPPVPEFSPSRKGTVTGDSPDSTAASLSNNAHSAKGSQLALPDDSSWQASSPDLSIIGPKESPPGPNVLSSPYPPDLT